MFHFDYNASAYRKHDEFLIPDGAYRVRITEAEEKTSSSGYPMIVLTLKVNEYPDKILRDFVVIMDDTEQKKAMTNQRLGRIFDSFKIQEGDLDVTHWKGKDGGAEIVVEENEYKGKLRKQNRVGKFLIREEVDHLPAWEGENTGGVVDSNMVNVDEPANADTLPF